MEFRHLIPTNQYLEIRYETLLLEPSQQLKNILEFINYPIQEEVLFKT